MNNVSQIIKQNNKNVSNKKEKQTNPCNCRNKNGCPLNGNCKVQNVIYKCTVSGTQTFKDVSIFEHLKETGSNGYIITDNHSKTRNIRTTHHYQIISGI